MSEADLQKYPCANCRIRREAVSNPRSFFARIHRCHSGLYPGWKNYQEAKRSLREKEKAAV